MKKKLLLFALLLFISPPLQAKNTQGYETGQGPTTPPAQGFEAGRLYTFENVRLLNCYDGDTCYFDLLGAPKEFDLLTKRISVRFLGYDTAEIKGDCKKERKLAYRAKKALIRFLKGKKITLKAINSKSYGRLMAKVYADGKPVAAHMLKLGKRHGYARKSTGKNWCK